MAARTSTKKPAPKKATTPKATTKATPTPATSKVKSAAETTAPVKKTLATTTEAAPVDAPEATVVTTLTKKELVEQATELSGVKRSEAKKAIEAALKIIGDAMQEGSDLNLPPLGKLSVNRQREVPGAHIVISKLRRPKAMLEAAETGSNTQEADAETASATSEE